jgi:ferredoxin
MIKPLIDYLTQFTESDWLAAVESLLPDIHEVDRNAVQVWFRFYPLELRKYIERSGDEDEVKRQLQLLGNYDLAEQIDTSHRFLYGHRYWPQVKHAIEAEADGFSDDGTELPDLVKKLSMQVSERTNAKRPVERDLLNGIILVGLMTLNQVGLEKFKTARGEVEKPVGLMAKSPLQIVAERKRDDSQGLFGFLRTVDKKFSVNWIDKLASGRFSIINDEEIASASAHDQSQDWKARDPRCWEGVVPVECRSASCGTCWIGILAGQEKLSEVGRRERRQMKVFGYRQPDDEKPFLRLACQAKAYGNATIVIPPWNGVFGKPVYGNVEELELEPVTTAAQKLRETLASVSTESRD